MYDFAIVAGSGPANRVHKDYQGKYYCENAAWTHEQIAKAIRNARARISRKSKDNAMRDLGLIKVRGTMGGTYYE